MKFTFLTIFRIVAFLEGVSFLLLLFVAVPIKYSTGNDAWVKALGMPHGLLFITYLIIMFVYGSEQKFKTHDYILGFFGSILPFGTFYVDYKLLRPLAKNN